MTSIDIIKSLYKPYKYTKNGSVTIIETTSGKFVLKKQKKDLKTLFSYLNNRGFLNIPKIINNYLNVDNIFEYEEEEYLPFEQKIEEFAKVVASYHNKTVYQKNTSLDNYKLIKDQISENINYINNHYENLFKTALKEEFLPPSKYLLSRNYYKIKQALQFCEDQIENWYESVKNNTKVRVSIVHNNLTMDHFIYNSNKTSIISWDNYITDTPILDLVNLYKNEYLNFDFSIFFNKYKEIFELLEPEKKLFFILISIPDIPNYTKDEFNNTKEVKNILYYLNSSEKLIRPYYSEEEKE